MQPSNGVAEQVEGVRRQAVGVLDELVEKAGEFELADPPPALVRYRDKLRENSFKVLVVGEAKRGKSTFVNALIGQDILPTDVDVATSQVFNITPAEREAYRVRFEDGSAREIPFEDLPRYGSQVMADAGLLPRDDQIIRWIEVDVPIRFLPSGVSILDTPGLGALYAGHARITHRFVPEADAVIFVLESGQPVVQEDLKFVEEILTVTRNIFFVQTKIDQYGKEDWQAVLNRNEEILRERFGRRLLDGRIWPVSSTNLRKAASVDEKTGQAYLMVSRHKELAAALQAFLARAAGWGRVAEAMATAIQYHSTSRRTLAGRLAGLAEESKQKQAEMQEAAAAAKKRFDSEWGIQGQKYRDLREGLQRAVAIGKQSFSNILQAGSDIELAQKAKIDAIKNLKGANRVGEEMPGEVVTAAMNGWARITGEVRQKCVALLAPLAEEAAENVVVEGARLDPDLSAIAADGGLDEEFKRDYFGMLRGATGGGMMLMGVSSMASLAGVTLSAGALAPVLPFVAVPALALLIGSGVKGAKESQVSSAQGELRAQLAELLQKVRRHFFDVDLSAGTFSRVDEYFTALDRAVNEQVRELVEKKSKESQAEIARLQEAAQLDERERAEQTERAKQRLTAWDNIGKSAAAVSAQVKALQQEQRTAAPA